MHIVIPDTVLTTDLESEGVLLNLETGEYVGLDSVAMDMWRALGRYSTVEEAAAALVEMYEVDADLLSADLERLIAQLADRKLVRIS